jgi:uncharacterized LabA/DUF88 family protein
VTTQNTESENNDINETVVQQSPASETPIASTEAEVTIPANEQDSQTDEMQSNASEKQIEEEPLRSFADYIEEFRQNEVQYGPVVEEPQVEPFAALMPDGGPEINEFAPGWNNTSLEDSILHEEIASSVEDVESHADIQIVLPVDEIGNGVAEQAEQQAQPVDEAEAALPVEEKPRPERRYRFDRRTPTATTTTATTQPRIEESKGNSTSTQSFQQTNNELPAEKEEQVAQLSELTQSTEQTPSIQEAAQEQVETQTAEAEKAKPKKTTHDARRRHGQERQREKVQATPSASIPVTTEATAPVSEIIEPQVPEVALEDLPPLEYSELQAASSRRRRKRRSGSSGQGTNASTNPVGAKSVTPEQTITETQISSSPVSPPASVTHTITPSGSPVPSTGPYSIQSGHTVSQMNQGNGESGPFMGPEPSPARGSGDNAPRNVRPIRNEVKRVPSYPVRSEGAASSASINYLANVVAQAVQTQSDRMVAELRRANQIPTNVSVSLPPFPSTERVGVFVDVANLLYSARTQRLTIDFGKLLDFLRGNRRLVRAHAYCPTSPQPGDDQMFLQAVKGLGYRITTKNYKTFSSGAKKADLDLDLCMDVVRLVDGKAVDCIVLVSGDSDFMPMLDYCSDHGVRVEVAAFDESMSATLRQSCDLFINLSMLDEIRA